MRLPAEIQIDPSQTYSMQICKTWTCEINENTNTIIYQVSEQHPANQEIVLNFTAVQNPRTFEPMGRFHVASLHLDKDIEIDDGSIPGPAMTIPAELNSVRVTPASKVNGEVTEYIFSI